MFDIYEPNTKFNKIYMFIGNTVTIGTACIGVISWFVKKISDKVKFLPQYINTISNIISKVCIALFTIGMVSLLIRVIYVALKAKSDSYYVQRKVTEFIHQKLVHNIRNNIVELEPLSDKLSKFASEGNKEAIADCYNYELNILQNNVKKYIDELSKYLTE